MSISSIIEMLGVMMLAAAPVAVLAALAWGLLGRSAWRAALSCYLVTVPLAVLAVFLLGLGGGSGLALASIPGLASGLFAPRRGQPSPWLRVFRPSFRWPSSPPVARAATAASVAGMAALRARPGVFVSYRRSDTAGAAGRLYDHLTAALGESRVYKDVDSIPPGADFEAHITQFIRSGATVLALIGPRWLDAENSARLHDEADLVRREIELARESGARLIPVLIEGAPMPAPEALPPSLRFLTRINALRLRADPDFRRDVQGLIAAVKAGA